VLKPDPDTVFTAIALGQDHTLALTSDGTILSWGLGRFSQLGYELPPPHVQSSPRVIAGPLRREHVRGVAACKSASACWTDTVLYTWGKNNGQLGYDKAASPVQSIPRVVTKVTKPVISVALNVRVVSHDIPPLTSGPEYCDGLSPRNARRCSSFQRHAFPCNFSLPGTSFIRILGLSPTPGGPDHHDYTYLL